jgi:hypothetical protein
MYYIKDEVVEKTIQQKEKPIENKHGAVLTETIDKLILSEVYEYSKLGIIKKLYNYFSYCRKIEILIKLKNTK